MASKASLRWKALKERAKGAHVCRRCGKPCSRKRELCLDCEKRWTGTRYAKRAAKDGDAMKKRAPGSFESGRKR